MKADTIVSMLADPNIDPTSWVGEALIEWVMKNTSRCLKDPVARQYLLRGMESNDIEIIGKGIIEHYKESGNVGLLTEYINGCNTLKATKYGDFDHNWKTRRVATMLNRECCNQETIDEILKLQLTDDSDASENLIKLLTKERARVLMKNRTLSWGSNTTKLLELFSDSEVLDILINDLWHHINKSGADNWPSRFQDLMEYVLFRIPVEQGPRFLKHIEDENIRPVWYGTEDLLPKDWSGIKIKLDERICRCGVISNTKPGMTLHRKKCDNDEGLNIYVMAKLLAAETQELACNKCGKVCKSKPGITLHRKKCKSTDGDIFRDARYSFAAGR